MTQSDSETVLRKLTCNVEVEIAFCILTRKNFRKLEQLLIFIMVSDFLISTLYYYTSKTKKTSNPRTTYNMELVINLGKKTCSKDPI